MRKINLKKYYPPGYEYRREMNWLAAFMGLGLGGSLYFFAMLDRQVRSLYRYADGFRLLRKDRLAASFTELTEWYWALWLPTFLFLLAMPLYHYFYYYRDTKSIYVMRRLSGRGVTFKSCVQGPVICAGAALTAAMVLYLLYFGIYMLSIPPQCMPRFV